MNIRTKSLTISGLVLILAVGCTQNTSTQQSADLVLQNGKIYTVNTSNPWAESVAIKDGRIVYVGDNEGVSSFTSDTTRSVDLAGKMVMPGMIDTHIHALGVVQPDVCDLETKGVSLDEMVPILKNCITKYDLKPGQKLNVAQWSFSIGNQPSAKYPTLRAALDGVSTEHPIILHGDDGHHDAANSLAFATARDRDGNTTPINKETLQTTYKPYAELISVDADGEPTGGISETARALIQPNPMGGILGSNSTAETLMPKVAQKLAASGITSVFDPFVTSSELGNYDWLEKSGDMTFRLRVALVPETTPWISDPEIPLIPDHIANFNTLRKQFENSKLIKVDAVKLFADAVLEGNPFSDPPVQPVSAMLNGFHRPQFDFDMEAEKLNSISYIDPDSDACKPVNANPEAYKDANVAETFATQNGFPASQCIPYSGILEHEDGYIGAFTQQMTDAGYHVHIHAIGDTAVRKAADAFEAAKPSADKQGISQSIVHMQVIHPDDKKRLGALGVFASFTFVWNLPEPEYELMVVPFIDKVASIEDMYNPDNYYMQNVYPSKSLLNEGATVMWGSDAPVGSRDPLAFPSLEQAINRSDGERVLNAAERLDIHEAIAAFTKNGAAFMGQAADLGTIEKGKIADLIVLDQNIVDLANGGYESSAKIRDTKVEMTIFDGKIVFEK